MGPLTYYPSKWFIESKLVAIRWIVRRVEAVVGRRIAIELDSRAWRSPQSYSPCPAPCTLRLAAAAPLRHDTKTNICRRFVFKFHVPFKFGDATRWVH